MQFFGADEHAGEDSDKLWKNYVTNQNANFAQENELMASNNSKLANNKVINSLESQVSQLESSNAQLKAENKYLINKMKVFQSNSDWLDGFKDLCEKLKFINDKMSEVRENFQNYVNMFKNYYMQTEKISKILNEYDIKLEEYNAINTELKRNYLDSKYDSNNQELLYSTIIKYWKFCIDFCSFFDQHDFTSISKSLKEIDHTLLIDFKAEKYNPGFSDCNSNSVDMILNQLNISSEIDEIECFSSYPYTELDILSRKLVQLSNYEFNEYIYLESQEVKFKIQEIYKDLISRKNLILSPNLKEIISKIYKSNYILMRKVKKLLENHDMLNNDLYLLNKICRNDSLLVLPDLNLIESNFQNLINLQNKSEINDPKILLDKIDTFDKNLNDLSVIGQKFIPSLLNFKLVKENLQNECLLKLRKFSLFDTAEISSNKWEVRYTDLTKKMLVKFPFKDQIIQTILKVNKIKSKHLIKMIYFFIEETNLYCLYDYSIEILFASLINNKVNNFNENFMTEMRNLLDSVKNFHSMNAAHLQIEPQYVCIKNCKFYLILPDIGCETSNLKKSTQFYYFNTFKYVYPESCTSMRFDCYSIGLLLASCIGPTPLPANFTELSRDCLIQYFPLPLTKLIQKSIKASKIADIIPYTN